MQISAEETEKLTSEVGSILEYVAEIQQMETGDAFEKSLLKNVMRDDVVADYNQSERDNIVKTMPESENEYLKVKAIFKS